MNPKSTSTSTSQAPKEGYQEMFFQVAEAAFVNGTSPYNNPLYFDWSFQVLHREEDRNYRITHWLLGTESTTQLSCAELALFLLFIREAGAEE